MRVILKIPKIRGGKIRDFGIAATPPPPDGSCPHDLTKSGPEEVNEIFSASLPIEGVCGDNLIF